VPRTTDCLSPIGENLVMAGLRSGVEAEFYTSITRPAAVYRGNPFQIEVGIAYGGDLPGDKLAAETLIWPQAAVGMETVWLAVDCYWAPETGVGGYALSLDCGTVPEETTGLGGLKALFR